MASGWSIANREAGLLIMRRADDSHRLIQCFRFGAAPAQHTVAHHTIGPGDIRIEAGPIATGARALLHQPSVSLARPRHPATYRPQCHTTKGSRHKAARAADRRSPPRLL